MKENSTFEKITGITMIVKHITAAPGAGGLAAATAGGLATLLAAAAAGGASMVSEHACGESGKRWSRVCAVERRVFCNQRWNERSKQ